MSGSPADSRPRGYRVGPVVAILVLAAVLRLVGIDHGLPRNFVPDTTSVRAALSIGAGMNPFRGDALPTQYPYLMPYALFLAYGAVYVGGLAVGQVDDLAEFEAYALAHPETFFLIARLLVAATGCVMVWLVILAARRLTSPRAALVAGWLTATSLILVQLAHQARPHVLTATLLVAALLLALRWRDSGRGRDLVGAWVAVALAGSATPYGFIGVVIPLAALRARKDQGRQALLWTGLGSLSGFLVLLVCYPRLLLNSAASFAYDSQTGVVQYFEGLLVAPRFVNGTGFAKLGTWLSTSEPTVALLLAPALVVILRGDRRRWLLPMIYPLVFVGVYGSYEVIYPRYLVSVIPFLALVVGHLVDRALSTFRHPGAHLAALLLLAVPLVQAARLDLLLARTDTRLEAEVWIDAHIPRDQWLGIEAHGVLPPPDLESLGRIPTARRGVKEQRRMDVADGSGRRMIRLFDRPGYRDEKATVLATATGLRYVALTVPGDEDRVDTLYRTLHAEATLVASFSPVAALGAQVSTRLPLELDNPLVDLWRVDRCGPIVEIFAVDPTR